MAYRDLRAFIEALDGAGELHRLKAEVDPQLVAGAISQRLAERGGPAAHFLNVKGAAHGATLVSGLLGRGNAGLWSRMARNSLPGRQLGNPSSIASISPTSK